MFANAYSLLRVLAAARAQAAERPPYIGIGQSSREHPIRMPAVSTRCVLGQRSREQPNSDGSLTIWLRGRE